MPTTGSRLADLPTVEVEVIVAAPPAAVWSLVADIAVPPRFSGELLGARWLDGATGPALGARFRGRNENEHIGVWETTCTVTACQPEWRFAWVVADPEQPAAVWEFELTSVEGGTRLRQRVRVGPGRSALTDAVEQRPHREERIVGWRLSDLERGMTATLAGMRRLAEDSR